MVEIDDENREENIRRKKDKKISKHFDILINSEKHKIIKFLIKVNKSIEREGKVIQLISKFNIQIADRINVKIVIEKKCEKIEIIGDWRVAWWGVGQSYVEYWINEMKKTEKYEA